MHHASCTCGPRRSSILIAPLTVVASRRRCIAERGQVAGRGWLWRVVLACVFCAATVGAFAAPQSFRAGAMAVDITPTNFPVIVNGGFLEKTATGITDRLHARALALDDGSTRLVICVVDTCMMPRDLIDKGKAMASQATGLPTDRMLVSATHTHSAPASMGCLGSRADTNYVAFLPGKIVEAIQGALKNLQPAHIGWAAVDDWEHTHTRRWIRRPDKLIVDPFGQANGRANMHPGYQNPDAIGPSGPVDPGLSVLSVKSPDGRPIALLANYSQHYYGASAVSADYYGRFAEHIANLVAADVRRLTPNAERRARNAESSQSRLTSAATNAPAFVGIMSQGTSGDQMWMDYGAPRKQIGYDAYAQEVAQRAFEAYQKIQWHDWVPLKMAERKLELRYRVPDPERLVWAREKAATFEDRQPKNQPEVYAREAIYLHERQKTELKLQAIRIGDLAICALPNEVYAITGLKLKAQSPLAMTFNIELANGAEGYIPPPEQHKLGGYTTWPARTAGLEVWAEPQIVETLLASLEEVADKSRRKIDEPSGTYAKAILAAKPVAYWRLNEIVIPTAFDASGHGHKATYEDGVALYLPGAGSGSGVSPTPQLAPSNFSGPGEINRAPHLAGGRITASLPKLGSDYSVSLWFWNGLPANARSVTGWLFARAAGMSAEASGEWLGIGGTNGASGKLLFATSKVKQPLTGKTELPLKSWQQVTLVREGRQVRIHLNGQSEPEIVGELDGAPPLTTSAILLGGRPDNQDNFEGRLDEVAVFDRALKTSEIAVYWKASGVAEQHAGEAADRAREAQLSAQRAQSPKFPDNYARVTLTLKPDAYWHLSAADGGHVPDVSPNKLAGQIEGGVSLSAATFASFNGGRIRARFGASVSDPAQAAAPRYSVSFWFRNDLANDSRPVTAYLFSHGPDGDRQAPGDHLGIGGTYRRELTGRLIFFNGNRGDQVVAGRTIIPPNTWNHVVFIRDGRRVAAFLNGEPAPEFESEVEVTVGGAREFFLGARSDQFAPLDGYLAEFALFRRALTGAEVAQLHQASGQPVGTAKTSPPVVARAPLNAVPPPFSPADALKKIHVREEYQVELVVAEPLTMDPVAIDWDVSGRLWVVEMADYPLGMDGNGKPGGRVRVLEDTDGDGRYDKSTIFADGLNFPNGILTWRDGVFVTAAPDILWLKDTNGDGRADVKEKVFSGFFEGNQQLRVNGLRWGLDNWVHCAAGAHRAGYGGDVRITATRTGKVVALGSHDLRFRPDTGEIDPCSGPTQYGLNRDDWGNWFGVQNSFPLWHYVLDDRYLRRNPHVPHADPVVHVIKDRNPKVYPISQVEKRYHSFNEFGRFTSACGAMIYRDTLLFSDGPNGHSFTCEPVHNIVHHEVVTDQGVSFTAARDSREQAREFFASEDLWCRPVMIRTGPDGALWVVDMYRYMIEHPQWLPPVGREEMKPHYRLGDDLGRIYRVFPRGQKPKQPARLDKLPLPQLVAALDSSNGWRRDKVQQLLVWRNDKAAVPLLEKMARENRNPLARLHALCTLDGLNALSPGLVVRALGDSVPGLRINALRLAEPRVTPAVMAAALKLVTDPDPKVRLQLGCTLGEWTDPQAGQALGRMAVADWRDHHILDAVMSSAVPHCPALVEAAANAGGPALVALTKPLLTTALALDQRNAVERLLRPTFTAAHGHFTRLQFEAFEQFLDLLAFRGTTLEKLAGRSNDVLAAQLRHAHDLFADAQKIADDAKRPVAERVAAVTLLTRDGTRRTAVIALLTGWLTPQMPAEARRAAVTLLARLGGDQVPGLLLRDWDAHTPDTRQAIIEELLRRANWSEVLLDRVAKGGVAPQQLDATTQARLLNHQAPKIRTMAEKLLQTTGTRERQAVVEAYRSALTLKGDPHHGATVFGGICANCHKLGDVGRDIGPDLRSVAANDPEKLLVAILDPNAAVLPGFNAYTCELVNGDEFYGLIGEETATSISMKLLDGTTRQILRPQVKALRSSRLSLMPEGLEANLKPQDIADVITFIRQAGRQ